MGSTAVLGYTTLMDIVNSYTSLDNQAQYLWIAEVMNLACPMIRNMALQPSNQIMSNIGSKRSYLPSPGTRRFNEGVGLTAAHKTPYTDPIAMVEDYSECDYALWKIQNDPNQWRQDEDQAHVEGLTQKMENLIVYGAIATDPAAFNGLDKRFRSKSARPNSVSTTPYNVISQGGDAGSHHASVWAIEWGKNKVFGIYPKNLPAGLFIEDLGKHTVNTTSLTTPTYMEALRTHFAWYLGLVVADDRCVQRLGDIEVTGTSNVFDEDKLIQLINQLPGKGGAPGTVIYCTLSVKTQLDIRAKDKTNVNYTPDEVWGGYITRFRGIPVYISEVMTETEAVLDT